MASAKFMIGLIALIHPGILYLVNWPIGSKISRWTMSKAHHITRKPKARSSPSRQIGLQSPAGQWMASAPEEPHPLGKRRPAR
jgi:hypothetical protein